jgi:hypothetical protein
MVQHYLRLPKRACELWNFLYPTGKGLSRNNIHIQANLLIIRFNIVYEMSLVFPNGDQPSFRPLFLKPVGDISMISQFFPLQWEVFT